MAEEFTDTQLIEEISLEDELARLEQEQLAIAALVDSLKKDANTLVKYPLERVRAKVGRWLVPKQNTLDAHFAMVRNRQLDIDFSPANYPGFDQIFTEKYEGKGFFDPEHANFPKYEPLRDNLATVRNYILTQYFPDDGTQDPKRAAQLKEIAEFLAEGLNNDKSYFGFMPAHNPFKPFIDVKLASAPNGEGARYLYSKILEMQRQSNWSRPFDKITELFGGTPSGGWGLPRLEDSIFSLDAPQIDNDDEQKDIGERIGSLAALFDALEQKRAALRERFRLRDKANDLNTLADQILFSYYEIRDGVEALAQPIRREAIDIAHDILNKMKIRLSSAEAGMLVQRPDNDDTDALGEISGVARLLQRMAGFVRSAGENALAIPAVAAAHQALGQIAFMAKTSAYNHAVLAGDSKRVSALGAQLTELKSLGFGASNVSMSSLIGKLQQGVDALSSRTNSVSTKAQGAAAHSENEIAHTPSVGTGSASQQQALTQIRLQQNQLQNKTLQRQQRAVTQIQQQHAHQEIQHAQQTLTQIQQVQQLAHPHEQASVFKTTINNKPAVNGNVARQNAKTARKIAQAEIEKMLVSPTRVAKTSTPPSTPALTSPTTAATTSNAQSLKTASPKANQPTTPTIMQTKQPDSVAKMLDPSMLAKLGKDLNNAQQTANTLATQTVGPASSKDIILQAKHTSPHAQTMEKDAIRMLEMDRQLNLEMQKQRNMASPPGQGRGR